MPYLLCARLRPSGCRFDFCILRARFGTWSFHILCNLIHGAWRSRRKAPKALSPISYIQTAYSIGSKKNFAFKNSILRSCPYMVWIQGISNPTVPHQRWLSQSLQQISKFVPRVCLTFGTKRVLWCELLETPKAHQYRGGNSFIFREMWNILS